MSGFVDTRWAVEFSPSAAITYEYVLVIFLPIDLTYVFSEKITLPRLFITNALTFFCSTQLTHMRARSLPLYEVYIHMTFYPQCPHLEMLISYMEVSVFLTINDS